MNTSITTTLFAHMSDADRAKLRSAGVVRRFRKDEVIFSEGDPGDGVYFVRSGMVRIYANLLDNDGRPLAEIHPGDVFGEMAVLDGEPRSACAVAEEDSELVFYSSDAVLEVVQHSPQTALKLARDFSQRLRRLNKRFIEETLQAERLSLIGKFARTIVHDFKNPLGIIGMANELGTMNEATPAMRENARKQVRKQVERLTGMISELLEFTNDQRQRMALARVDYREFLTPLLEDLAAEARLKKVQVVCHEIPSVEVLIDSRRLPNVFFNLIHNAVEALQPQGGVITLRFQAQDALLLTEMTDSGKGIPLEVIHRLFQPFATFGKASGTGLGLSICKRIIEDQGGTISGRNGEEGGAVFAFTLQRAQM